MTNVHWREDTPLATATPTQARLAREHAARMRRWHPPEPKAQPSPKPPEAVPKPEPVRVEPAPVEPIVLPGWLEQWRETTVQPMPTPKPPSHRQIQETVAAHFDLTRSQMLDDSRERPRVRARQIGMTLCLEMIPGASLPLVGKWFKRDHTTVIHARDTVHDMIASDPDFADEVDEIRQGLRSQIESS